MKEIDGALEDRPRFETEFVRLGVDEGTAAVTADRMVEAIRKITELGDDDPVADAERLEDIAQVADELDELADTLSNEEGGLGGELDRLGRAASETITNEIAKEGFAGLRHLIRDNWTQIASGLILAWRAVKGLFT